MDVGPAGGRDSPRNLLTVEPQIVAPYISDDLGSMSKRGLLYSTHIAMSEMQVEQVAGTLTNGCHDLCLHRAQHPPSYRSCACLDSTIQTMYDARRVRKPAMPMIANIKKPGRTVGAAPFVSSKTGTLLATSVSDADKVRVVIGRA
jgi:hypothetical protein